MPTVTLRVSDYWVAVQLQRRRLDNIFAENMGSTMKDFDKRLISLISEAMESSKSKEDMGQLCYYLTRTTCFLHAQEFGADNGERLMRRVTEKIFEELGADEEDRMG